MPDSRNGIAAAPPGEFLGALQRAHATSRGTAVALDDLPAVSQEHLRVFVNAGMIREAEPDTFYIPGAEPPPLAMLAAPTYTPMRVALMMGVWLLALAVPFLVWLFAR